MPKHLTAEHRAKIGAANRRRIVSDETRAKMSAAAMGNPGFTGKHTAETKAKLAATTGRHGELNSQWKGDEVGYGKAHLRHGKVLPQMCAHADDSCKGRLEVAFNHDTPEEFVRIDQRGCPYSPRSEDYMRLCQSHHKRYDARQKST